MGSGQLLPTGGCQQGSALSTFLLPTDGCQLWTSLTPVLSDAEGNHDPRHFLISVDPRPAPADTTFDPDQDAVVRTGVEIRLPRAAYESPGADPGETAQVRGR